MRGGVLASAGRCPLRVCASPPRTLFGMSCWCVYIYVLLAPSSRPCGRGAMVLRVLRSGPPPRPCWLGGPPPLLALPAPDGRAPPRWSGLRESGVRLRRAFFSATALGVGNGGWGSRGAPPCVRVPRPRAAPFRSHRAPVSDPQRVRGAR